MSDSLYFGRLQSSVAEVIDAADLLPHYELAAIAVLEGQERPGEEPAIRRHLRAEGIRPAEHRGTLLVDAGSLERMSSVGLFGGGDEVYFSSEWNEEFEPFPGRISSDAVNFAEGTPLGLEEWMADTQCLLVLGDGNALNYATTSAELHQKLSARYPASRR